jgi:AcrR family transcriptional regulator
MIVQLAASRELASNIVETSGGGRRAARMQATQAALRRAAIELISERGFDATSTDDIARAAGVSPRTFFNYFPTKQDVIFLPEEVLPRLFAEAIRARPVGEDPVATVAAATIDGLTASAWSLRWPDPRTST